VKSKKREEGVKRLTEENAESDELVYMGSEVIDRVNVVMDLLQKLPDGMYNYTSSANSWQQLLQTPSSQQLNPFIR